MTAYAFFNEAGRILRFEHVEDDGDPPAGGVALTEEQFNDLAVNQALRRWDGQRIVALAEIPLTFTSVSAAQAKTALYNAGLLDDVEAIVNASTYRPVQIFYHSANNWEKTNAYVMAIAHELGLTDEQFNDLFDAASKL